MACSGGRDSLSLACALHLLCPARVRIVHINHQLQAPAAQWARWLAVQCQQWQLPCTIQTVNVAAGNIEAQARKARYQALFSVLQDHEILVLGHHQQDQAETIFLRLMSGSGVKGLSAMQAMEQRNTTRLWRPLLNSSRQQITELADLICPEYIDDPANTQDNFDRVFLRQQVWPLLKNRWPSMDRTLSRTALLMQDSQDILQEVLAQDWSQCGDAMILNTTALELLSQSRQRLLLSRWMQGTEQYAPAFHLVEAVRHSILDACQDATPKLEWQGWQFRRYQNQLYRLPQVLITAQDVQVQWHCGQVLELPTGQWQWQQQPLGFPIQMMQQLLSLRARRGGEVMHVQGRSGHWPLKKCLQEAKIAPWQRAQVHLCTVQDQLLGVFTPQGFWVNQQQNLIKDGWLPCLVSPTMTKTPTTTFKQEVAQDEK